MSINLTQDSCYHCGLDITVTNSYPLELGGIKQQFCCPGCQAVAKMIHDSGLENFYDYRTQTAIQPEFSGTTLPLQLQQELELYDQVAMQEDFVEINSKQHSEATLSIEGITCAACVWLLDNQLSQLQGVIQAKVNLTTHRAVICWDPAIVKLSQILTTIYSLGYKTYPFSNDREALYQKQQHKLALRRLALAGIGMMQVMMFTVPLYVGEISGIAEQYKLLMRISGLLLTTPVVFYAAKPFFVAALRDLRARYLTMDIPVSLAIGGAYSASVYSTLTDGREVYFDSVCMFTFFLLLGRFLEMQVRHRSVASGNRLLRLLPDSAIRLNGKEQEVIASKLLTVDGSGVR